MATAILNFFQIRYSAMRLSLEYQTHPLLATNCKKNLKLLSKPLKTRMLFYEASPGPPANPLSRR